MKASEVAHAIRLMRTGMAEGKDLAKVIDEAKAAGMNPQVIRVMSSALSDGKDIDRVIQEGEHALAVADADLWDKEDEPVTDYVQFALIVTIMPQVGTALQLMLGSHGDKLAEDVVELPTNFLADDLALDEWRTQYRSKCGPFSDEEKITSVTFIENGLVVATKNYYANHDDL